MSTMVREGEIDVAILAGPRVREWPSWGVRLLTAQLAEYGLTVGQWGGPHIRARGVLVSPRPGGIVIAEDAQQRIHRIRARAVVRVLPPWRWTFPFEGSWSEGMLPLETAEKLLLENQVSWQPGVVVMGTGNEAFRFAVDLLRRKKASEVHCLELFPDLWGGKRYAGWEVERRRFEIAGGKIIEGAPVSLKSKGPQRWELRIQDRLGIRPIEVGRVVTVGPFDHEVQWSEYPVGSLLFGFRQTALEHDVNGMEGFASENRAATAVVQRILKALTDHRYRPSSKQFVLSDLTAHRDVPYMPQYRGKLLDAIELDRLKQFAGVPKKTQRSNPVASIECIENIPCNACEKSCPVQAIGIKRKGELVESFLLEDKCVGCGKCVNACPSQAIVMVREKANTHHSWLYFPKSTFDEVPTIGEPWMLTNRKGESLGTCRVSRLDSEQQETIEIEIPNHLLWDGRGLKRIKKESIEPGFGAQAPVPETERIECTVNQQKRLCRPERSVSETLFEMGLARPSDTLLCTDGTCGLCAIEMDGVKRLACQTKVHQGMKIRIPEESPNESPSSANCLCPCLSIHAEEIVARIQSGHLSSIEAVLKQTGVGKGTCHGMRCLGALRQLVESQGIDAKHYLDWSFPFSDWTMVP